MQEHLAAEASEANHIAKAIHLHKQFHAFDRSPFFFICLEDPWNVVQPVEHWLDNIISEVNNALFWILFAQFKLSFKPYWGNLNEFYAYY